MSSTRMLSKFLELELTNFEEVTVLDPRVIAIIVILCLSLFAVTFPSLSQRIRYIRIPKVAFFIGKHFGTGVILSTAFCHLLQDAFKSLQDPRVNERWTIGKRTGAIILGSLLSIFLVEYISASYVERLQAEPSAPSSRQASPTQTPEIPSSPLPGPNGYSQLDPSPHPPVNETSPLHRSKSYAYGTLDLLEGHHRNWIRGCVRAETAHPRPVDEEAQEEEEEVVSRIGRKRQVVGILALQLGIMIHSFVIGMTLAIVTFEYASLLTAILFHQLFEGLSLGIRIAALPIDTNSKRSLGSKLLVPILSVLFAITTPLGIAVGMLRWGQGSQRDDDEIARTILTRGIMSSISAGMLIYASCVEMLGGDFLNNPESMAPGPDGSGVGKQALALCSMLAGVICMVLID